ncbi:MAG: hypothetical protein ACFBRM_06340 [Pikeienuella sp.]
MTKLHGVSAALLCAGALATPALGQELNFQGSFSYGGFDRYVPPVTHPTLNETPFITTEVKPIFLYHSIPSGFVTDGGRVIAGAVQARLALTERFGIIATTDGYADIDFEEVLPDADGFLDLAAGVKYAIINNPAEGNIVSVGIRYTAPVGNIDTAGIDLTGSTSGQLDTFISGAKLYESGTQVQGSVGFQWGISDRSWSFIHAHAHIDHEVFEGFFPLVEANLIAPVDGGNRIEGASLTGADVFDIGASDPTAIMTLGIGARYNPLENVSLGAAIEGNVLDIGNDTADSVFGWRVTTDVTIRF